jgi:hypothetical protein
MNFGSNFEPQIEQNKTNVRPRVPKMHLMSEFLKHTAKVRFGELYNTSNRMSQTRLLSCSGPSAGKCLTASAGLKQAHFGDCIFTQIIQWRLGVQNQHAGIEHKCCNVKADGDPCEEVLDPYGNHAAICCCGPMRILRHNALTDEVADCICETGAHVRREVWIREFASPTTEAILDVWAFGTSEVADLIVDVTISHPGAASYQPNAATTMGHTAAMAETRKAYRYPSAAGRSTTPFAAETWGRLGHEAEGLLSVLSAAASRRSARRGQYATATSLMKRWRAALDSVLQRGVAMSVLAASRGLAGRLHRRRPWNVPSLTDP